MSLKFKTIITISKLCTVIVYNKSNKQSFGSQNMDIWVQVEVTIYYALLDRGIT